MVKNMKDLEKIPIENVGINPENMAVIIIILFICITLLVLFAILIIFICWADDIIIFSWFNENEIDDSQEEWQD